MTHRAGTALIVGIAALAAVACGGGGNSDDIDRTTAPGGSAAGGWIGGEPPWQATTAERDAAATDERSVTMAAGDAAAPASAVPREPLPGSEPVDPNTPLRAGSVDDNAAFADFLAYLDRAAGLGIAGRPFDPSGRIVVHVVGSDDRPVDGAAITAMVKDTASTDVQPTALQTDASGTARFLPGPGAIDTFQITVGEQTVEASRGDDVTITLDQPGGAAAGVAVDVMFVLDATGSMGDEIAQLRTTMIEVAQRLDALSVQPDIRFAMTVYRDEGDAFVTSTYDFTDDVAAFTEALAAVVADGGGDTPEALDEALAAALGEPAWRDPATTVQLMFLVADAPPQIARQVPTPYTQSIVDAAARGITIHAIGASNTDDQAEVVFRQVAQATGGRFVFLAYSDGATATGPNTDIDALDYEELPLGDLVVRLVSESLATLTGAEVDAPPATTVPPTNPPGQD
jgi:hypothetical protein